MTPHDDHPVSIEEAREALERASSMHVTSRRDVRTLTLVTLGIGTAMALVLLLIHAAGSNPYSLTAGMIVYAIVIIAFVAHNRRVGSVPRGYGMRYGLGIAGTSLVYVVGVFLLADERGTWGLAVVLALLTVLPAALAAFSISRLAK